jgi:hypothetical protein
VVQCSYEFLLIILFRSTTVFPSAARLGLTASEYSLEEVYGNFLCAVAGILRYLFELFESELIGSFQVAVEAPSHFDFLCDDGQSLPYFFQHFVASFDISQIDGMEL